MATETVDKLWSDFQALPIDSREAFLERLVDDQPTRENLEDLLDLALAEARSGEPTRSLDEVLAEIER
jgi:hypothetical protein